MISQKDRKARVQRSRWSRSHQIPGRPNGFDMRHRSLSNTDQMTVTLKGASARSKAPISLPQMPWDSDDHQ